MMIGAVIKKEFLQLFRNRLLFFLLWVAPVVILGLIPPAFENLVRIRAVVVDEDNSPLSRRLLSSLRVSPYFESVSYMPSVVEAEKEMDGARADLAVVIPSGFERQLRPDLKPSLQLLVDGSHTLSASDYLFYLSETLCFVPAKPGFVFEVRMLFNRLFAGKIYFLVSLLVLLITLLGVCFAAISVVNEKEQGILDQLEVTPMHRLVYLAGKLFPFLLVGLSELLLGLGFCLLFYDLHMAGSVGLLLLFSSFYLLSVLGLGLTISILSDNQVQAMYLIIFVLLTLILMSTMFSLLSSMPQWAQQLRYLNPIWFMLEGARAIILKGVGFKGVVVPMAILAVMALVTNGLSVFLLYLKRRR